MHIQIDKACMISRMYRVSVFPSSVIQTCVLNGEYIIYNIQDIYKTKYKDNYYNMNSLLAKLIT